VSTAEKKPSFPEQFPTSAKPVYLRYGVLVVVLSAIFAYLYFEGRPEAPVSQPSPLELLEEQPPLPSELLKQEEELKLTD